MNRTLLLKSAPLLLAASFALAGATAAHAQISSTGEFSFTAPTSTALIVHPGDSIKFSGSLVNDLQLEQIDAITISMVTAVPGSFSGFTFSSPFSADLAEGQTLNFTGTLKISKTSAFTPTFFYLDANGIGDTSGETYDLTSDNFKVTLAPSANPVPEASTTVSLGLLLALGGLGLLAARRKHAVSNA